MDVYVRGISVCWFKSLCTPVTLLKTYLRHEGTDRVHRKRNKTCGSLGK